VNLIGEHTDYNEGFVLRLAIDRATVVAWAPRDDAVLRVLAVNAAGAIDTLSLETDIQRNDALTWSHYVRGMARELRLHRSNTTARPRANRRCCSNARPAAAPGPCRSDGCASGCCAGQRSQPRPAQRRHLWPAPGRPVAPAQR